MDQSKTPLLDALADYHRSERYGFCPPGHRQGRGTDERGRMFRAGANAEGSNVGT